MKITAFYLLLIPLLIFANHSNAQSNSFESQLEYLSQKGKNPSDYVIGKFDQYDVVFLGEDHAVKNHLDFVRSLISKLYEKGVYNLGIEFGAYEMQSKVDSLITADSYNEALAKDILYFYHSAWPYKEYLDLYKAAWQWNKSLPKAAKKFRILNISYQFDWSSFEGMRTPEKLKKVFKKGPPDSFRASVVENEVIKKGEKVLLLVGVPHAFTSYKMPILDINKEGFCRFDDQMLGNKLYSKYPTKVFTILFHCPFYRLTVKPPYIASPANGAIEKIMKMRKNVAIGFDLAGSPMGLLKDSSNYSMCYDDFTLGKLMDGYIFIKPFKELEGCTIDTLFYKNKDWETTKKYQQADPSLNAKAENMIELWKRIKGYANVKMRYAELIKE